MSSCTKGSGNWEGALCGIYISYAVGTLFCLLKSFTLDHILKAESNPKLQHVPPFQYRRFRHSQDRRDWEGFIRLEGGISRVHKEMKSRQN